jgi:hypothetical protein
VKKILISLIMVLFLLSCGDAYYDNVIGITPMDEIAEETQDSMGNVFENSSTTFGNNTSI